MDILLLLVGLALILGGANYLTDGASALAQRLRMPEFLIGLTIVAIGTSMPEMVVSVLSSINGQSDMAIGNVVGSNIFNVFMVLGLCSIIHPIAFTKENIRFDIPFCVLVSALFVLMACDTLIGWGSTDTISRFDGAIMLLLYIGLMTWTIRTAKRPEKVEDGSKPMAWWLTIVMIVGGLCGLVFGGELFLDSATSIARKLGISESVIAITLVAGGTSLPELAASVVSFLKGKVGMALGNVVGSNIANILLILGVSSTINPLTMGGITLFDLLVTLLTAVLLYVTSFTFRRRELDRAEGVIFLLLYAGYIYLLVR